MVSPMLSSVVLVTSLLLAAGFAVYTAASQWPLQYWVNASRQLPDAGDAGDPLFLTPMIEAGDIRRARRLASVTLPSDVTTDSYSGFLTVNKDYDSNLFFWFFPAMTQHRSVPLLLWLSGGPGVSSLFGVIAEHGPFSVDSRLRLIERPVTWVHSYNMLYIDNPQGTGFSFTTDERGYAQNQTDVGRDLYRALLQFFTLFPEYQQSDFYVVGESYGGKFCLTIAHKIHTENPTAKLKINLKGVALGNAWLDPATQVHSSDFLYYAGLLDALEREEHRELANHVTWHINSSEWLKALNATRDLFSYFQDKSGFSYPYNFLHDQRPDYMAGASFDFLEQASVRRALHVGSISFATTGLEGLAADLLQSVKPQLEKLLREDYNILLYSGQLDAVCPYSATSRLVDSLQWPGKEAFRNATREKWYVSVGGEDASGTSERLAGYWRQCGRFSDVLVRNAGQAVPSSQPEAALAMVNRFTSTDSGTTW